MRTCFHLIPVAVACIFMTEPARAVLRTAGSSGYWTNSAVWGGSVPTTGDDVRIASGISVTVDVSTAALSGLTNSGTLVFRGWDTVVTSQVVRIDGMVTHDVNTDTTGSVGTYGDWTPDNRVHIVCSNLLVATGGSIDVDGKGYLGGGIGITQHGYGPGGGIASYRGGGSYGGLGGYSDGYNGAPTIAYGSALAPTDPGSGGGGGGGSGSPTYFGNGGGAVRIDASGTVSLNGTITADGMTPQDVRHGGGSGGGIYITCRLFAATNGAVSAQGANSLNQASHPGDGAGGRIAIVYDTAAQAALNAVAAPAVTLNTSGAYSLSATRGGSGTVFLSDTSFYPPEVETLGNRYVLAEQLEQDQFVVSNVWAGFQGGHAVHVTNDILVWGAEGRLDVGNYAVYPQGSMGAYASEIEELHCGGNMLVTNSAALYAVAGVSADASTDGAHVSVGGALSVEGGSALYPNAHPTNGGPVRFTVGDFHLDAGSFVDANDRGWRGGTAQSDGYGPGPGQGTSAPGGRGGRGAYGGTAYGSSNSLPFHSGSGGGGNLGNGGMRGGGLFWLQADGNVTIDGTIRANGLQGNYGGSGAGGGIYLSCRTFSGNGGTMQALGGANPGTGAGGGGGGRIAVWRTSDNTTGLSTNVAGGGAAGVGSIFFGTIPPSGTIVILR